MQTLNILVVCDLMAL